MLYTILAAALVLVGQPLSTSTSASGPGMGYGTVALYHEHHAVSASGIPDNRSGWIYRMRVTHSVSTPAAKKPSRHPAVRHHARPAHHPSARRRAPARTGYRYQARMLITYYTWTGNPMANGIMPSIGWAACGYDLTLGTRVGVPGVGILTCGDRIGYSPWQHIDVYGIPLGTSKRLVTVY